ncbi:LysR family transcriptional regulator [Fodinisporobacter ferrooxydans]|uniref:LysR family transcriptional regulator n=1 Tax=Fodinisporobacter ferrooxydans TaxID=2901836 RepID=A0ABY4CJ02_9BACL|nr:LysR family transcriptional regulator [Alicyclobacillaceae bacterium MYW30-H2]
MLDAHLHVFLTVAEKRNFSRAAEFLNLTQPAISQQIQTLEEYYGAKLFERTNKRVELTQAGHVLVPYAQKIMETHHHALQAVNDLTGQVTGKLTIGASLTIGEYILPKLLANFSGNYPKVEPTVKIGNTEVIAEHMLSGTIDLGLIEGPIHNKHLHVVPFLEDEMLLIVPANHMLNRYTEVEVDDVANETFLLREAGSGTRFAMEELLHDLSIQPKRVIQLGSLQSIKEGVEAGLGISFLSKWTIQKEIQLQSIHPVRIKGVRLKRQFSLLNRKGQFASRAVTEFMRVVQETKWEEEK